MVIFQGSILSLQILHLCAYGVVYYVISFIYWFVIYFIFIHRHSIFIISPLNSIYHMVFEPQGVPFSRYNAIFTELGFTTFLIKICNNMFTNHESITKCYKRMCIPCTFLNHQIFTKKP